MVTNIRVREEAYKQLREVQLALMIRDKRPDYSLADIVDEVLMVYNEYKDAHDKKIAMKAEARLKEERSIKKGKK